MIVSKVIAIRKKQKKQDYRVPNDVKRVGILFLWWYEKKRKKENTLNVKLHF